MICDMCHKREAIGIIRIGERQVHMCTLCLLLGAPIEDLGMEIYDGKDVDITEKRVY